MAVFGIAANNVGLTPVKSAAAPSLRYIEKMVLSIPLRVPWCNVVSKSRLHTLTLLVRAAGIVACCRILTTSNGLNANTYILDPIAPERILDDGDGDRTVFVLRLCNMISEDLNILILYGILPYFYTSLLCYPLCLDTQRATYYT